MFCFARGLTRLILLAIGLVVVGTPAKAEDISLPLAEYLQQAKLADAEAFLKERLTTEPEHAQARFALGLVQVLSTVEKLGQDHYQHGLMNGTVRNLPVFRLPLPSNPDPQEITYPRVRQIVSDFQTRLLKAEAELAQVDIKQDVKLRIDVSTIQLDLNGDGKADKNEGLLHILGIANQPRRGAEPLSMRIQIDAGDLRWLQGYCHFLAGFCDIVLAYDHQRMFDHTGQLLYPRHVPSEQFAEPLDAKQDSTNDRLFLDLIAAIHLMNFPLKEPARMENARQHLLRMIRCSRESWELILAETDNELEWIPNPRQTGILNIAVTDKIIESWHEILDEVEDLLEGRKLLPFWRDYARFLSPQHPIPPEGRGVNLKRCFTEPREFDLILWVHGSAALPYVEHGALSHPNRWNTLTRTFQGRFFGFALWFN